MASLRKITTRWLRVSDLKTDPRVQRRLDHGTAAFIARNFDPDKFGIPLVSLRKNGDQIILDGQTRIHALRLKGWENQRIQCEGCEGLSVEDEARMWLGRNGAGSDAKRRSVTPLDQFSVSLTAKNEEDVSINQVVTDRGLRIVNSSADGSLRAVGSLRRIYEQGGEEALGRTLDIVLGSWGDATEALDGRILLGLGNVLCWQNGQLDEARLRVKLARVPGGPIRLLARARQLQEDQGGAVAEAVSEVILMEYNKGLRSNQLPAWRPSKRR
jgi:hypothetical protein